MSFNGKKCKLIIWEDVGSGKPETFVFVWDRPAIGVVYQRDGVYTRRYRENDLGENCATRYASDKLREDISHMY